MSPIKYCVSAKINYYVSENYKLLRTILLNEKENDVIVDNQSKASTMTLLHL